MHPHSGPRLRSTLCAVLVAGLLLVLATPLAAAQPADDPARVRELAERLLATGSAGGFGLATTSSISSGPALTARLLPGRIPDGLPIVLPLTQRDRVVGSVARMLGDQLASVEMLIDAPGAYGQIQATYEN